MLEIGKSYERTFISKITGGGFREYLPYKNGKVVCATVRRDVNPDAPGIIIVTTNKSVMYWANKFASQKNYVPVFIKEKDGGWCYFGDYRVKRIEKDKEKLYEYSKNINVQLSMLLFLEEKKI